MMKRSWTWNLISRWILSGSRRNEEDTRVRGKNLAAISRRKTNHVVMTPARFSRSRRERSHPKKTMRLFSAVPLAGERPISAQSSLLVVTRFAGTRFVGNYFRWIFIVLDCATRYTFERRYLIDKVRAKLYTAIRMFQISLQHLDLKSSINYRYI